MLPSSNKDAAQNGTTGLGATAPVQESAPRVSTIVKATIEYSDGMSADFTGDPLDLATIPTQSPDQQAAETAAAEAAEPAPADATKAAKSEAAEQAS